MIKKSTPLFGAVLRLILNSQAKKWRLAIQRIIEINSQHKYTLFISLCQVKKSNMRLKKGILCGSQEPTKRMLLYNLQYFIVQALRVYYLEYYSGNIFLFGFLSVFSCSKPIYSHLKVIIVSTTFDQI